MNVTPDIERVQEWDDFLAAHELPAQTGRNLGQYRVEWICSCGHVFIADGHRGETAYDMHQRHLAEQIAALVEQREETK